MWAAHNSILLKDDNSYKQMISQAPICDKQNAPRNQDLFPALNGKEKLSKLYPNNA